GEEPARVDAEARRLDGVEILREGLDRPLGAAPRLEALEAHALDLLERAQDQAAMIGTRRRDPEAAVADDDAGDAMPRRDRAEAIPEHLRVVVRVDVDEARRDDLPGRVNGLARGSRWRADRDQAAVPDPEVAAESRRAGAVDERASDDPQVVVHGGDLRWPGGATATAGARVDVEAGHVASADGFRTDPRLRC